MKNFSAVLILLCFSSLSFAQSTGDNFQFNPIIKAQQQVPATPTATIANGTPIVVTAPAAGNYSDILGAINTAVLALIAGLLGFKKAPTAPTVAGVTPVSGAVAATPSDIHAIVASIAARMSGGIGPIIADPTVRASVDNALLQLERSGLPSEAIRTVSGFVPAASPLVAIFEPMIRNAVDQGLTARLGAAAPAAGTSVALPASIITDLTAVLGKLVPKPA